MFFKYADAKVLDLSNDKVRTAGLKRLGSFDYEPRTDHKFLYVSARACTADVPNLNYDMLPHDELKEAYKSFIGSYVYLNHDNTDPRKARGAIIDAKYHYEDENDRWVEILMEMDEEKCPKLCSLMRSGDIDTVSMGCSIKSSTCSVCGNTAEFPHQFCNHIQQKGRMYDGKLAFEICNGIEFFEESVVFDPADPSAHFQGIEKEAMRKSAAVIECGPDDFYESTIANFEEVERPDWDPDYISSSGSMYWYLEDGVVRGSDHWGGGIGSCDWFLNGDAYQGYPTPFQDGNDIDRYGFCAWGDFEPQPYISDAIEKTIDRFSDSEFWEFAISKHEEYSDKEVYAEEMSHSSEVPEAASEYIKEEIMKRMSCKKASIGYIEEMNNGRYWVSCGTPQKVDEYWYASADTEEEAIDLLLEDTSETDDIEEYTKVDEIYVLKDYMFGERKDDFQEAVVRVIASNKKTSDWYSDSDSAWESLIGYVLDNSEELNEIDIEEIVLDWADSNRGKSWDLLFGFYDGNPIELVNQWMQNIIDGLGSDIDPMRFGVFNRRSDRVDNFSESPRKPDEVSTIEDNRACPLCGSLSFDGEFCDVCGYQEPPEGFDDIDLETKETYEEYHEEAEEEEKEDDMATEKDAAEERFYDIGDDPEQFIMICEDEGFSEEYSLVGFDVLKTTNGPLQDILEAEGAVRI